jgi:hypothetical protein
LGLEGDVDETVWADLNRSPGATAWYDADHHEVVVLGRDPGRPLVRGRLLEELTRAVVHQRLRSADSGGDRPEDHVRRALLAGDALRIARDDARAGGSVPAPTLDEVDGLGESTVRVLLAWGGQQALDDGQRSPAPSVRAIFDPLGWEERPQPADIDPPRAEDGEKVVARGWLGPTVWLRLLAPANTFGASVRATYGWSGDAYTLVRRDDETCIRVNVATDSLTDAVELDVALTGWVAAGPGGARQVAQQGEQLFISACSTAGGPGPLVPSGPSAGALSAGAPSTAAPSTAEPSTAAPSTAAPSTAAPPTSAPPTSLPPAGSPSTSAPPAEAPATSPSTPPGAGPSPTGGVAGSIGAEALLVPIWVNALVVAAAAQQPRPEASVARCAAVEAVASTPLNQLRDAEGPRADLQRRYTAALDNCWNQQGGGGSSLPSTSR